MSQLINIALSQYGVTEIVGYQHNPVVLNYFKEIGHTWVATDANVERSHKLTARSWLNVGTAINQPKINDVVIFWRHKKSSWKGHVGFFISYSEDKKHIYVLGGNQNNQVNIKKYPVYRLLGFRRLSRINS